MIKYRLGCPKGHQFDSWFASGTAFEDQAQRHLIACPHCQSTEVDRVPMAPALVGSRKRKAKSEPTALQAVAAPGSTELMDQLRQFKRKLLETSDYVGPAFAQEARKIHFGESEERAIYGEATLEEARSLDEDGIAFGLLPALPEDHN